MNDAIEITLGGNSPAIVQKTSPRASGNNFAEELENIRNIRSSRQDLDPIDEGSDIISISQNSKKNIPININAK